jgi:hypothetical protein
MQRLWPMQVLNSDQSFHEEDDEFGSVSSLLIIYTQQSARRTQPAYKIAGAAAACDHSPGKLQELVSWNNGHETHPIRRGQYHYCLLCFAAMLPFSVAWHEL